MEGGSDGVGWEGGGVGDTLSMTMAAQFGWSSSKLGGQPRNLEDVS